MVLSCVLVLLLFFSVQSELLFTDNANPILNMQLDIPQIPSPYKFSTKTLNLDAIGNHLNPKLNDNQDIHHELINNDAKQPKQQKEHSTKQAGQQTNKSKPQNPKLQQISQALNQQQSTNNQSKQTTAEDHPLQPILLKNINASEQKLQKIDISKLMKQIEKEYNSTNQTEKQKPLQFYQQIFGSIDQQLISNSTKIEGRNNNMSNLRRHQQIQNNQSVEFKNSSKQQTKSIISDRVSQSQIQQQKTEKSELQIQRQGQIQKVKNSPKLQKLITQSQISQSKQLEWEKERQKLQKQLIQFKFKYFQLQKQLEEDKEAQLVRKQLRKVKSQTFQEKKSNTTVFEEQRTNYTEAIFCLNLRSAIKAGLVLLFVLILLILFCRKRTSYSREDSQSEDRQKLSSDDQID